MKPKFAWLLVVMAVCIGAAAVLVWFWPVSSSTAISSAKSKPVHQLADKTWGGLIAEYERATGVPGTWQAKRPYSEQWSWEVTYTHPGIGPLWFGIDHFWSPGFMDENSVSILQQMLDEIRENGSSVE